MKSIDFKSLLIGVLGTALVLMLMEFTIETKWFSVRMTKAKYQMACGAGNCGVLNTETGVVKVLKANIPSGSEWYAYSFGIPADF